MNEMSIAEVIQWQAQYAIAEGMEIVYNAVSQSRRDKAEQWKILNS
jgi:hypothetical protein